MTSRFSSRCAALLLALAGTSSAFASNTTTYTYDELGRLRSVSVVGSKTSVQTYSYDAAGNRTQSTSGIVPSVPTSISVPTSSITGAYTISWGASTTGTVTAYELYQATNASFSGQTKVYSGTATSSALSGRANGTYYYRVRACSTSAACSAYRTGGNSIVVTLPPGTPASISVPSGSITGSYAISWGTSTGNVTAYELQEATNSSFTGATLAYTGTGTTKAISGKGNGAYYYRVRACNTSAACSAYRTGASPTSVTLPPSVPGAASVPVYSNTGSYTISWGASTGLVTAYELLEYPVSLSETLIYSGTATSTSVSAKADRVYSYRVRACNTSAACSGYTATQGNGAVITVDKTAPQPPTSLTRTGQTYLNWSGGSTDTAGFGAGSGVDRWRVYRSGTLVATVIAPMQAYNDSAAPSNQTYTYTVRSVDRAGNESVDSPPLTVFVDTLAPGAPTGVSAVGVSPQSIQVTWNAAVDPNGGTIAGYFVYLNGANQQLASGTSFVYGGLSPSTTYSFTVSAYDNVGNVGPQSAPVNGTTQAQVPTVPLTPTGVGVSFTRYGHPSYTIYWNDSGPPTSYYVLDENGTTYTITGGFTSKAFSSKPVGFYSYKVKACSATNVCSQYSSPSVDYEVCGTGGCQ